VCPADQQTHVKLHFAYAIPWPTTLLGRVNLALTRTLGVPRIWNRRRPDTSRWSRRAPWSITANLFSILSSHYDTRLYTLGEPVTPRFRPDDIFLGHPTIPVPQGADLVTDRALSSRIRPRVLALITPLHFDVDVAPGHIDGSYLESIDRVMDRIDVLFAIMGPTWWDRWPQSTFAHWLPKMVRLDMALDASRFPRVKTRFNPPGKRRFLHIGRNHPMKGTDFLSRLFSGQDDLACDWIGIGDDIPGIGRLSGHVELTPELMGRLAADYDFFITTGRADPNPTTILEAMAWGFPVVCTPQSGYDETPYRRCVWLDDLDGSREVLRQLQSAPEAELRAMADEARQVVCRDYAWSNFERVPAVLAQLYAGEGIPDSLRDPGKVQIETLLVAQHT